MPATVTLRSTTLADGVDDKSTRIKVGSTTGMVRGLRLYVDKELMAVQRLDIDPWVIVTRGVDGTPSLAHAAASPMFVGRADQFYMGPPEGKPQPAIAVSPYIDVVSGFIYFAQGDVIQGTTGNRWWQIQTQSFGVGPLGVRTVTLDPTSST